MKSSDPMFQLTSKKWLHVEFWCSVKEKIPQFSEDVIKMCLPFSTIYLCEDRFYTSAKTMCDNRVNAEIDIHLSSVKHDIIEICKKSKIMPFYSTVYFLENRVIFLLKICYLY